MEKQQVENLGTRLEGFNGETFALKMPGPCAETGSANKVFLPKDEDSEEVVYAFHWAYEQFREKKPQDALAIRVGQSSCSTERTYEFKNAGDDKNRKVCLTLKLGANLRYTARAYFQFGSHQRSFKTTSMRGWKSELADFFDDPNSTPTGKKSQTTRRVRGYERMSAGSVRDRYEEGDEDYS